MGTQKPEKKTKTKATWTFRGAPLAGEAPLRLANPGIASAPCKVGRSRLRLREILQVSMSRAFYGIVAEGFRFRVREGLILRWLEEGSGLMA